MTVDCPLGKDELARRSVLKGALLLGGGAALGTALEPVMARTPAAPTQGDGGAAPQAVPAASSAKDTAFSQEFLSNPIFRATALNTDPPAPVRIDGNPVETGALLQPNGDIRFRIYAPQAQDVTLKFDLVRNGVLVLDRQANGLFEGLLPYDDNHTGPMSVDIYVDGMMFLYPYMPIHWSNSRPHNFIEVPDAELEFIHVKNVPHGSMSRELYRAGPIETWARCNVYTPPGYMKSSQSYPVLYLQHGGGENERVWEYAGRVANILDNLIAADAIQPFIVVMNNDMLRYPDNSSGSGLIDDAFERILIESCIPFIEKTYRVKADKWNRALAGLSMGSMMSCDIFFRHPEVFANLATLTASMTHEAFATTYERPYPRVMRDSARFASNYRVYFRSTAMSEDHFDYFLADDKLCAKAGIDKLPGYHRTVYPPRTTKWNSWRLGLRDYAQLLFRPSKA